MPFFLFQVTNGCCYHPKKDDAHRWRILIEKNKRIHYSTTLILFLLFSGRCWMPLRNPGQELGTLEIQLSKARWTMTINKPTHYVYVYNNVKKYIIVYFTITERVHNMSKSQMFFYPHTRLDYFEIVKCASVSVKTRVPLFCRVTFILAGKKLTIAFYYISQILKE